MLVEKSCSNKEIITVPASEIAEIVIDYLKGRGHISFSGNYTYAWDGMSLCITMSKETNESYQIDMFEDDIEY